ncbi:MAG: phosphoadenosine phosphosulfate reductase family protein [Saprospiraceae bacterium]|nr:phosphoadenosine phosphosulfate reductase family protein [Saprospiraceae bacterium]
MSILRLHNTSLDKSRISVDLNTVEALRMVAAHFPGRAVFETKFSPEDQVITHLIFKNNIPIRVFTRSSRHEYDILKGTIDHYGKAIEISFQQAEQASKTFAEKHPEQVAAWNEQPHIAPLSFVLESKHVAISSSRNEQVANAPLQWDEAQEKFVFSPLIYWTDNQIFAYILDNHIPHREGTVPVIDLHNEATVEGAIVWNASFRKFLPQHSIVSGSFNIVHQIATFFRLPQHLPFYSISSN